ncbi:LAG1-domain-containing protein [Trichodelitschia bisporula]|uniref:LAG1-domain-containing protein n=1 Tax=Trichodelitschia bisporula TaxID=703511 RepID=A0A6G1HPG2_9PEZI|nr:LAG1-domain-containing protein [Trichodelitschia bisporula]
MPAPPLEPFPMMASEHKPTTRPRNKSNSLGGDPRGDTGGPALATAYDNSPSPSPALTPTLQSKTPPGRPSRRSKRRKVRSLLRRWKTLSFRHTWLNPLLACIAVVLVYLASPTSNNPVYPAIFLSYPLPREAGAPESTPVQYGKGKLDFAFVAFYTVFLSFTREFIMQRILRPLALRAGIMHRAKQARFMEQAYTAIYFAIFGPFGLYVMSRTPVWYFNTRGMYEGFPHRSHEAVFKAYYLLQASYWLQQAIVLLLLLEKPRKDFKELVAHHIITLALIGLSYRFHFTYMGLAVYITHDISDFFLATSKLLNYLQSNAVIPYFIVFLGSWAYLRHFINLSILSSMIPLPFPFEEKYVAPYEAAKESALSVLSNAYTTLRPVLTPAASAGASALGAVSPKTLTWLQSAPSTLNTFLNSTAEFAAVGPFASSWDTVDWAAQQYKCGTAQWIAFLLLLSLQLVNIFWFFLILRVLWRIVVSWGSEAEDERSEYDDDEEEERVKELETMRVEQEGKPNGHVKGLGNGELRQRAAY